MSQLEPPHFSLHLKHKHKHKYKIMALLQTQTQSHLLLLSPSFTTNSNSNSNRILFFSPIIRSEKASHSDSTPTKGKGFGSSSTKDKIIRQRASILRRSPLQNPSPTLPSQQGNNTKEHNNNNNNNYESSFVLAWLAFGAIILLEGIALAASGFLPEEWDKLFVKYLYPSFTPTVFLFIVGAVAYGVIKYLQNEKITDGK
ncbi:unnamed protein product [Lupinus luteus]|uniref:Protein LOW PSII ACCUMULATION 2, chloroplastic n=1 Tax=Lupinus luteus TaxID=3873 RepID=A0AAV1W5B5_LUPLU